jgi:predicted SnoaL-like aldol condensation-catalyzing enzyme
MSKEDRGTSVVDIFRVEDGKVVEHWDIIQPVPESPANANTMF